MSQVTKPLIIFYVALIYFPLAALIFGLENDSALFPIIGVTVLNVLVLIPTAFRGFDIKKKGHATGYGALFGLLFIGGAILSVVLFSSYPPDMHQGAGGGGGGSSLNSSTASDLFGGGDGTALISGITMAAVVGVAVIGVLLVLFVPPLNRIVFPYRQKKK